MSECRGGRPIFSAPTDSKNIMQHGTNNAYSHGGCRCGPCVAAKAAYRRESHPQRTARERFQSRTIPEPNTGCLLWTGSALVNGYGVFERQRAHRVSWEMQNGSTPEGRCVLHRCDTPACVNPDHLFIGTVADNNADMLAKGRKRTIPKQEYCAKGHRLSDTNVYTFPHSRRGSRTPERRCRICKRLHNREWMRQHGRPLKP